MKLGTGKKDGMSMFLLIASSQVLLLLIQQHKVDRCEDRRRAHIQSLTQKEGGLSTISQTFLNDF